MIAQRPSTDANERMDPYRNRELSWLDFNERVLQEAEDDRNPLLERLKFLAIFSSNLDEFYRVRVAGLRSLGHVSERKKQKLGYAPDALVLEIQSQVDLLQARFGRVFRETVLPGLLHAGIPLLSPHELGAPSRLERIEAALPDNLDIWTESGDCAPPFLKDGETVLVCLRSGSIWDDVDPRGGELCMCRLAFPDMTRFIHFSDGAFCFVDDAVRMVLSRRERGMEMPDMWAVKLSRDADLHLEDEFTADLAKLIRKSLKNRETGRPTRLLYDGHMPQVVLNRVLELLHVDTLDAQLGGRYHNFSDFFGILDRGHDSLRNKPLPPLPHPVLSQQDSLVARIREADRLLHVPHQSYAPVVELLRNVATRKDVEEIRMTVYRVSSDSEIIGALCTAACHGKRVFVFVELKARFDEASNLSVMDRLREAGAVVETSRPGIKVHAKLVHIRFSEGSGRDVALVSTGNFNEKTARLYDDVTLFTARPEITADVGRVFNHLEQNAPFPLTSKLLVAPNELRRGFMREVHALQSAAREGRHARMMLKMNSLEDPGLIDALYDASADGVQVDLIVRGICCLRAGVPGLSENICVISILDRFLEHARVYVFECAGQETVYMASADWMTRNMNRRIEVAVPVLDHELATSLKNWLELQLSDNVKARTLKEDRYNQFVNRTGMTPAVRAQIARYEELAGLSEGETKASG